MALSQEAELLLFWMGSKSKEAWAAEGLEPSEIRKPVRLHRAQL